MISLKVTFNSNEVLDIDVDIPCSINCYLDSDMNTANIICYYKDKDPSKPVNCKNVYQGTAPSSDYWTYKNPMSNEEYEAYSRLYDIARNYLVIQNGTIFSTGYGSERSLNWEAEANAGKNFLQILKETYGDVDIIECSGSGNGDDDGDLLFYADSP